MWPLNRSAAWRPRRNKRAIAPSMQPNVCPRQGRWNSTPRFYAAGTGGVATVEICVSAAAELRPTIRTLRRYIAARVTLHCTDKAGNIYSIRLYIYRSILLLLWQCCGALGSSLGTTIKYLRRTTSGAAGNGLGTDIKYLRRTTSDATNNDRGATIKYLSRATCGAAGIGLGTTIKYLRRPTSGAADYFTGTAIKYLLGTTGISLEIAIKYLFGATGISLGTTIK